MDKINKWIKKTCPQICPNQIHVTLDIFPLAKGRAYQDLNVIYFFPFI